MKLSKFIPDNTDSPTRLSLVRVNAFIQWLRNNKPEVYKEAIKALGAKDCQQAFDDIGKATLLWR